MPNPSYALSVSLFEAALEAIGMLPAARVTPSGLPVWDLLGRLANERQRQDHTRKAVAELEARRGAFPRLLDPHELCTDNAPCPA